MRKPLVLVGVAFFLALGTGPNTRAETAIPTPPRAAYDAMILWGHVGPPTRTARVLDWDVVLEFLAPDGGVRVRRELRFERGDRVLPQRSSSREAIRSSTGLGLDGVVVRLSAPADVIDHGVLRFTSQPVRFEIPLTSLVDRGGIQRVDEAGNGVMLIAVRRPPQSRAPVANGFTFGQWAQTTFDGGSFAGERRSAGGRENGFLVGHWTAGASATGKLEGEVIGESGQLLAFAAGKFQNGAFEGDLRAVDHGWVGTFRGIYTGEGNRGGHFLGVSERARRLVMPEPPLRSKTRELAAVVGGFHPLGASLRIRRTSKR